MEEEEKDPALETSATGRASVHQNLSSKNQLASSIQNLNQINLLQMNDTTINDNHNFQSLWLKQLNCGFVTMPLGTDNVHIPLNDCNIGSLISYVLSSNIYKEAMIKQNYMDIGSKIKLPSKHQQRLPPGLAQNLSEGN